MASTSTTARKPNRAALDGDDAMALRAAELAAWAQRNVRSIITAAVVAGVVVAALLFFRMSNAQKAERAASEWLQVQPAVFQGAAGVPRLSAFATSFAGTPEAAEARLAIAGIHLDQNQAQQAIQEAQRVVDAGGVWEYKGLMTLGAAQARANQRDAAIQTYLRAATAAELDFERQEARSEAALLHEEAGNWTAAAQLYTTMLEETEKGSLDRAVVELRKAEAESRTIGARR